MAKFTERIKSAWNAFQKEEPLSSPELPLAYNGGFNGGYFGVTSPARPRVRISNERSIVSSIYTRLGIDVAAVDIRHVRLDEEDRYLEDINSGLNERLTVDSNIDQTPKDFKQDIVATMFDKGVAAIVPVDTSVSPNISTGYDILSLRVGEITQWFPRHVRVRLYNDRNGQYQEITCAKDQIAIVTNPLYSVMNEPNSTLQRLIRKLNLLDAVDEQSSSGRLDLIIQLPYVIKSEARKQQAQQRREELEFQLKGSQYGVAYTDGSEKITQLNRPTENNLLKQIEYLTDMLYGQLGLTPEIMLGTADEQAMLNYYQRTIKPIVEVLVEEMRRKFLTKTARTQRQSIAYFIDPFELVPINNIAEIADKFTRNEILTSNEVRQIIGRKPSSDPKADQLINSNMPEQATGAASTEDVSVDNSSTDDAYANINSALDEVFQDLGVDSEVEGV